VPACLIALLPLPACHTQTAVTSGRAYPRQVARGPTLDIQVFRRTRLIELTNTTARPFGQSTLWLNGRFCHAIGGLAVGEHAVYRLADFTDEFGEPYRAGGFFATETPDRLVLAEIETPQEDRTPIMLGLVVVGGE
jgi:hypothetical protein